MKLEDYESTVYPDWGNIYEPFIFLINHIIDFIEEEYVPLNQFIKSKDKEINLLIRIMLDNVPEEYLKILAVHAIGLNDKELIALINKHLLLGRMYLFFEESDVKINALIAQSEVRTANETF